jgi:hypothetical protein
LAPIKGDKELKHHEVIVDFTWRALVQFIFLRRRRMRAPSTSGRKATGQHLKGIDISAPGALTQLDWVGPTLKTHRLYS